MKKARGEKIFPEERELEVDGDRMFPLHEVDENPKAEDPAPGENLPAL
ncbi:MAG: hypothetical protein ABI282_04575 [Candidatus Baltobacteraceae bacterium]